MSSLATTVVIPTLNRPVELQRLLGGLAAQFSPPAALVVVDQSDPSAFAANRSSLEALREKWDPEIHHVKGDFRSITQARNLGAAQAVTDLLTFLDDDMEIGPSYLGDVEAFFRSSGCIMVAGVPWTSETAAHERVLLRLSRSAIIFRRLFRLSIPGPRFRLLENLEIEFPAKLERPELIPVVNGGNFTVLTSVAREVGWDPALSGYALGEDWDFSLRVARRHPGQVWLHPGLPVLHRVSPSERLASRSRRRMRACHLAYVFLKNRPATRLALPSYCWSRIGHAILGSMGGRRLRYVPRVATLLVLLATELRVWFAAARVGRGDFQGLL